MTNKARIPENLLIETSQGEIGGLFWPGHGRPVVCLHGFLDSAYGWEEYAKATHRPVYALHLPGFGTSADANAPTIEAYTSMLQQAIVGLNLPSFSLVGHSMGGLLAAYVSEKVEPHNIALVAPVGFGRIPLAEIASVIGIKQSVGIGLPLVLLNPFLVEAIYRIGVSGGHSMPLSLRTRLIKSVIPNRKGAYNALLTLSHFSKTLHQRSAVPPVLDNKIPLGVLWGKKDLLVPASHAENLKAMFPHAHVEIWEGVAHHPHVEIPDRLHKWIEKRASKARSFQKVKFV